MQRDRIVEEKKENGKIAFQCIKISLDYCEKNGSIKMDFNMPPSSCPAYHRRDKKN